MSSIFMIMATVSVANWTALSETKRGWTTFSARMHETPPFLIFMPSEQMEEASALSVKVATCLRRRSVINAIGLRPAFSVNTVAKSQRHRHRQEQFEIQ